MTIGVNDRVMNALPLPVLTIGASGTDHARQRGRRGVFRHEPARHAASEAQ